MKGNHGLKHTGVEQLAVGSSTYFIDHSGLQVQEDSTGHMLASTGLGEEGVEGIISVANGLVRGHLTIGLDAMLKAVKLPASIADLGTGLSDVDGNHYMKCNKYSHHDETTAP
jgi:hypothetical protein